VKPDPGVETIKGTVVNGVYVPAVPKDDVRTKTPAAAGGSGGPPKQTDQGTGSQKATGVPPRPSNDWISKRKSDTKAQQNEAAQASKNSYIDAGGVVRVIKDPTQLHHVASDKSSVYTPEFEEIFEKGNLGLQDPENKIEIEGHKGAHGPDYNEPILRRIQDAVKGLTAHSQAYRDALIGALRGIKKELAEVGSYLNRLVTGRK
jgi:hypothetical protein